MKDIYVCKNIEFIYDIGGDNYYKISNDNGLEVKVGDLYFVVKSSDEVEYIARDKVYRVRICDIIE